MKYFSPKKQKKSRQTAALFVRSIPVVRFCAAKSLLLPHAFPMAGAPKQHLQSPHPFIVGLHGVFFLDAVHYGFDLNIRLWDFFLLPVLASRQQQGGQGCRCCCRNKGFRCVPHGWLFFHHLIRIHLPILQGDLHQILPRS